MHDTVFTLEIRAGFDVSTRSRILPESNRVGSFTMLVRPYSLTISSNLLCVVAVCNCWFVVQRFSQLMSGRFKSPAIMIDGGSLQER